MRKSAHAGGGNPGVDQALGVPHQCEAVIAPKCGEYMPPVHAATACKLAGSACGVAALVCRNLQTARSSHYADFRTFVAANVRDERDADWETASHRRFRCHTDRAAFHSHRHG